MKSLLLIVASLFAYNENANYYERTDIMFNKQNAVFVPQANTYFYTYRHNPGQMGNTAFTSFRDGSKKLIYEIPTSLNVDASKSSEFYIMVNTTKYYFENELGYITGNYYSIPNFFDFGFTSTTDFYISIPSFDGSPTSNYQSELDKSMLYTREAFIDVLVNSDYLEGFDNGFDQGVIIGEQDGYDLGLQDGYDIGFDSGFTAGVIEATADGGEVYGLFAILGAGFSSLASILSIQILPGFTLGLLLFLPVIFGIAYVLLKFLLGGSS